MFNAFIKWSYVILLLFDAFLYLMFSVFYVIILQYNVL